jgi:hypothetical protein
VFCERVVRLLRPYGDVPRLDVWVTSVKDEGSPAAVCAVQRPQRQAGWVAASGELSRTGVRSDRRFGSNVEMFTSLLCLDGFPCRSDSG